MMPTREALHRYLAPSAASFKTVAALTGKQIRPTPII